ncbi:MAG TPA: AraC family transcriptional regulator [Candidatus Limnocylindria bacterium]|nr:AraC family transcriptional regulator [Candidatus Limnocylindria bacterium]
MANHSYASVIDNPSQLRIAHTHEYFEISLVRRGVCVHHVNGGTQRLQAGSLNFIRPADAHWYQPLSQNFSIVNVLIPQKTIQALFDYLGNGFEPARLLDTPLSPVSHMSLMEFTALQSELEQLILYKKLLGDKADAMFNMTLMNVITKRFPIALSYSHTDIPSWLRLLLLEMLKKENFSEGIEAMYRLCGKSPEHISRSCRKHLGLSPGQLIRDIRLHHAAVLLMSSDEEILDICHEAGFNNLSNFYHQFTKAYGMTPKAFRTAQDPSRLGSGAIASVMLPGSIPAAQPPPAE